jgi:hypothetical protein
VVKHDDNQEIVDSVDSVHTYLQRMVVLGIYSAGFTASVLFTGNVHKTIVLTMPGPEFAENER